MSKVATKLSYQEIILHIHTYKFLHSIFYIHNPEWETNSCPLLFYCFIYLGLNISSNSKLNCSWLKLLCLEYYTITSSIKLKILLDSS